MFISIYTCVCVYVCVCVGVCLMLFSGCLPFPSLVALFSSSSFSSTCCFLFFVVFFFFCKLVSLFFPPFGRSTGDGACGGFGIFSVINFIRWQSFESVLHLKILPNKKKKEQKREERVCEGESGIITGPVGSWNLGIRSSSGFGTPSLSFSAGFGASRRSLPSPLRCVSRGGWARSRPPRSLSLQDGVKGSTRESEREREWKKVLQKFFS